MSLVLALTVATALLNPPAVEAQLRATGAPPLDDVLHDVDADGRLYAAGANYKMIFGPTGAEYVPLLGARAPKNSRFAFHVDGHSTALPLRDGNRVSFDRGTLVEIYDLGVHQVEQSFLLRAPLGESELRVSVATDAVFAGRDAAGLRFDAQGLATVTYGDATLIDARGDKATVATRFEQGAIRIALPDGWQNPARYPIVVDPVISTVTVDGGSDRAKNPDVAYASSVDVFQVSYTKEYSATDSDVLATRYDACGGTALETIALDITSKNSLFPRVAFSSPHFMTVWSNDGQNIFLDDGEIEARARVAGSTAASAKFVVSNLVNDYPRSAAIGGNGPGGRFLIAFQEQTFTSIRVVGRLVTAAGNVAGLFEIDDTDDVMDPVVSPSPNSAGRWLVAYTSTNLWDGSGRYDLHARQVNTSGAVVGSPFAIANSTFFESDPAIATDGTNFFVAFARDVSSGTRDIFGRTVTSGTTPTVGTLFNLTALEPSGSVNSFQSQPALSFDGVRYALAYVEGQGLDTPIQIRGATFFASPAISFQEGHVLIQGGTTENRPVRLAGAGFDQVGKHMVVWSQKNLPSGDEDARGAFWSTLQASGGKTVLNTGCGGPAEPILVSASIPALGTTCTVTAVNTHAPLLAIGPPVLLPACSASCQIGVGGTTYLQMTSPTVSIPIGSSPSLLGTQFAVQVMDFLPPANATEFCNSGGQNFMTSDTLVFTVQ
ncbi:MAG: hypothetical protein IT459_06350 [Planctomycetes bacterium]|nr:hypothetical protein [Planctomycetota bacterium]